MGIERILNADWMFTKGDLEGAHLREYEDDTWVKVNIPHSASMPYWGEVEHYKGWVWYRKHFEVSYQHSEDKVFIEFEAVFQHSWVYVNGNLVGEHKGGYTGFSFDITAFVDFGKDNVLAVRTNNLWNARIAPRAGDHNFHAGIYRNVYLVMANPLHVTWAGIFVTTPTISEKEAMVNVKTEIKNDSNEEKNCTVKSSVFNADNELVTVCISSEKIASGEILEFTQDSDKIQNPHLWSTKDPYLYKIYTEVFEAGILVDKHETSFGMRWFSVSASHGFFLNGKHLYLNGFNAHQDHAGWGDAVTDYGFYRDMKMLKDAGANCVRASHYPHAKSWYDACDRLGLLVWAELHLWGRGGFKGGIEGDYFAESYPTVDEDIAEFEENLIGNFKDQIRTERNHASIFLWSLGNENAMQVKDPLLSKLRNLYLKLNDLAHQADPTRLTGTGDSFLQEGIVDLSGGNGGNPRHPLPHPAMISEYGSNISLRPGVFEGFEPTQHLWRAGALQWCAFHHGTHCGVDYGHMGVIDYYRLPLRQYYWYRSYWRNIDPPVWARDGIPAELEITADKVIISNSGTDDCQLIISVLDAWGALINSRIKVNLMITSGPGSFPTGDNWEFITIEGQQAIEFRSFTEGKSVIRATAEGIQPGIIEITTIKSEKPVVYVEPLYLV